MLCCECPPLVIIFEFYDGGAPFNQLSNESHIERVADTLMKSLIVTNPASLYNWELQTWVKGKGRGVCGGLKAGATTEV